MSETTSETKTIRPRHHWKAAASPLAAILSIALWLRFIIPPPCGLLPSVTWLLLSFLSAIAAVYLGHSARRVIRNRPDRLTGSRTALVGLILAYPIILGYASAALFAPTIDRSPQAARESMAVNSLRKINGAEQTYAAAHQGRFGNIHELIEAGLLDSGFEKPVACYTLDVTISGEGYEATAVPVSRDAGRFGYFSAADGVIRYSTSVSMAPNPEMAGDPVQ
jgi:hypothetical protein